MADLNSDRKFLYIRWVLLRLGLVVFDVFTVNFAYYLALLVRFYVNFEFNVWAVHYVPAFMEFSPYYTVCSLIVFAACGLYKSIWKYAGLHDINRIFLSSIITCVIQIAGTLIFVIRMPITYYALGAAFQFTLIAVSRFSYRVVLVERDRLFNIRRRNSMNVLIVGTGEDCRTVIKYLERDSESRAYPVCVVDFQNSEFAGTISGVPVLGGIHRISDAVKKYDVDRVVLADISMKSQIREDIGLTCKHLGVSVQLFSEYFQTIPSRIPLLVLSEYTTGPVMLRFGNEVKHYESAKQAAVSFKERYIVDSIAVEDGILQLGLVRDVLRPNDTQVDWVINYQKETGEDVSFF